MWWHSGWRDATVVRRLRTDADNEEEGGGLDYVVVFDSLEPPEGHDASLQFMQFMGGLIQLRTNEPQELDKQASTPPHRAAPRRRQPTASARIARRAARRATPRVPSRLACPRASHALAPGRRHAAGRSTRYRRTC